MPPSIPMPPHAPGDRDDHPHPLRRGRPGRLRRRRREAPARPRGRQRVGDGPRRPGWWTGGATPGDNGVSVLVAHFDTKHGPALMKDVKKIKLGDLIEVPREGGRTAKFKIREIEDVNKKDFPTDKVYGETRRPELRLLTCGGEIKDGHRTNNVIFYADLVA
ncbi:sortase domain-containing protein [Streptomyces vinaceus]|uniref:sortase domain-containing protein n=1 Tax=Streptomyces vinaceus TaxID=1960 RepID=UPI003698E604